MRSCGFHQNRTRLRRDGIDLSPAVQIIVRPIQDRYSLLTKAHVWRQERICWKCLEVFLTINGKRHYLWRAVDQDDNVLDILVQSRRNKKTAKKFFRKLLKGFLIRNSNSSSPELEC